MSVARAKVEITPKEFSEWVAYSRIEPFGNLRGDLRSALMTLHFVRTQCTSESARNLKVSDFMLDFRETAEESDNEDKICATISIIGQCLGKRDGNEHNE